MRRQRQRREGAAAEVGEILSRLHWQCWRAEPPPLAVDESELLAVLPILIRSGSVGLVWPRLRGHLDPAGAMALALEDAYEAQVAHNETCRREIAQSVARLREAGIDPVLVKGWAVSRLYPPPLVRPAGDIDLVVLHGDFELAKDVLTGPDAPSITVGLDLQDESTWYDRPEEGFWDYATDIEVDGVQVRVPSPEDHVRLLSLHFLRHGAVRPGRLCDIAMMVETRTHQFDWGRCLGEDPHRANWVRATLGLAHCLQRADLNDTPVAGAVHELPAWLLETVGGRLNLPQDDPSNAFGHLAREPRQVITILRRRWPDPVSATLRYPARFSEFPRLPLQWMVYLRQIATYARFRLEPQAKQALKRRPAL